MYVRKKSKRLRFWSPCDQKRNLVTLLPWPLNQLDHGTESFGHALVLILGLILLREMDKAGELKNAEALA